MNLNSADAKPPEKFLTVSNLLSLLRIILAVPFVVVLLAQASWSRPAAIAILALGALTDRYDGIFARKYHQETEWGRILDPLADKVGIAAAVIVFLILGNLPLWFVIIVLARDVVILLGGIYVKFRTGRVLSSIPAGKWTVGTMALTLLAVLLGVPEMAVQVFVWATIGMVCVSLGLYVRRFFEALGHPATGDVHGHA